jgi:Short C-terminal domain/Phospholipase_D-nuclease N-terminal
VIAYTFPLLDVFWSIIMVFLWVFWIFILVRVVFDIFLNRDLGGVSKALWFILVVILPFFGVLVYLIVHGGSMHERQNRDAKAADDQFRAYVRETAGSGSADELAKLAALRDQGVITTDEFEKGKAKVLG